MKGRIEQLKELSLEEWQLLLFASVLLPVVALSLRMKGFNRTQKTLCRYLPKGLTPTKPTRAKMDDVLIVARMVTVAADHGFYRANCLKQALVLWWLLLRRGIKSEIVFGIPKEAFKDFNAHAWVECNGINLSDDLNVQKKLAAFQKSSK